jgi:ankyrin repeat protein
MARTVDVPDEFGQSAFNCAMIKKKYDIARLLLDHHADIDRVNTNHSTQFFLTVVYASNSDLSADKKEHYFKLTKRLLRLGANCQIGDRVDTPLQWAARQFCSPQLFTLLLDYGAGIGCNFNRLYRCIEDKAKFQTFLEAVTENQIVIFLVITNGN